MVHQTYSNMRDSNLSILTLKAKEHCFDPETDCFTYMDKSAGGTICSRNPYITISLGEGDNIDNFVDISEWDVIEQRPWVCATINTEPNEALDPKPLPDTTFPCLIDKNGVPCYAEGSARPPGWGSTPKLK